MATAVAAIAFKILTLSSSIQVQHGALVLIFHLLLTDDSFVAPTATPIWLALVRGFNTSFRKKTRNHHRVKTVKGGSALKTSQVRLAIRTDKNLNAATCYLVRA
jgi:hypothetical protein